MSKTTFFNTRFWQDSYIADLDPSEKLLFNYCLTSPFLSLCGIYEVPTKFIATETGIDKEMVIKIIARFEKDKKIAYKDGWLCVLKYPKYQSYNLPNVKKGLENEVSAIPPDVLSFFVNLGYEINSIAKALPIDCQGIANKVQGTRNKVKEEEEEEEEKPTLLVFGEFKNVRLTEVDHQKLIDALNEQAVANLIAELDGYIESTGKKYKSHYATIQNWARRRIKEYSDKMKPTNPIKRQII